MLRCAEALKQASHFTKITQEADGVFQTNDIHKVQQTTKQLGLGYIWVAD
jgi:hypothetical protein